MIDYTVEEINNNISKDIINKKLYHIINILEGYSE